MHVRDHAHNGEPASTLLDNAADRIFLGPEFMRHRLINDDHTRSAERILLGELTPFEHWHSQSAKIIRTSYGISCAGSISWSGLGTPFDLEAAARPSLHRQMRDRSHGHNPWNRA